MGQYRGAALTDPLLEWAASTWERWTPLRLTRAEMRRLRGSSPQKPSAARRRKLRGRDVPGVEYMLSDPCAYCGDAKTGTYDHVEPITRGGTNELDNIARACWPCNVAKGTQSLLVFMARRRWDGA